MMIRLTESRDIYTTHAYSRHIERKAADGDHTVPHPDLPYDSILVHISWHRRLMVCIFLYDVRFSSMIYQHIPHM
jgi:hypothetical protein